MHSKKLPKPNQSDILAKSHSYLSKKNQQVLSQRYRALALHYIAARKSVLQIKNDHDNLINLVEKEALLRSVVESQRDDLESKLTVIRDILRNKNDAKLDKDYIKELEQKLDIRKSLTNLKKSSSRNESSKNNEDSSCDFDQILPPRRLSRHSAGSLLDPDNLSHNSEDLSSHVSDSQITDKTLPSYFQETRRSVLSSRPGVFLNPPVNDDYFDMDVDEVVGMPPILTDNGTKVHFNKIIDSISISSQNTLSDAASISSNGSLNRFNRRHDFNLKTSKRNEICHHCGKRIPFGKTLARCENCRIVSHPACKSKVLHQCLSIGPSSSIGTLSEAISEVVSSTTGSKTTQGVLKLENFCPLDEIPRIPAIVIMCINEVAFRGLDQLGIYRLSGSDKQIKELYEKFMRLKVVPNLSHVNDINVICGCLKLFIRNLDEPLITYNAWPLFAGLAKKINKNCESLSLELKESLDDLMHKIPAPNRDTLSYLMIHLRNVANSPKSQMDINNLARVFGPTVAGHSNAKPGVMQVVEETTTQQLIVKFLLLAPSELYLNILKCSEEDLNPAKYQLSSKPFKFAGPTPTMFDSITPSSNNAVSYLATPARLAQKARSKFFPSFNRHNEEPVSTSK